MAMQGQVLRVDGRDVRVNKLEKVMVPASNTRKADVIDYYIKASKWILPHLEQRPLTLKLFIDGFGHPVRFLKNAPTYTPDWVKIAPVSRRGGGPRIRFVLANDLPTLVWTAALSNLEMHTFLARAPRVGRPTMVMFDLDPGAPASVLESARVAVRLRNALNALGLESFPKSSGSKGIHVAVALNVEATYETTENFARMLAEELERRDPQLVTTVMAKDLRVGKVFVDYTQNIEYKSTACVYSLRATDRGAFVSMPLSWSDLESRLRAGDARSFFPTPESAIGQLEREGDLFEPVLSLKQQLPGNARELLKVLSELSSLEDTNFPGKRRAKSGRASGIRESKASKLRHRQ